MIEHGQGYEDSGRPMTVVSEVWPVAADQAGLWLLGDGPRASLPVMDDAEPHDYAEMELMQAGMWATTRLLHSTSWRVDYDQMTDRNYLVVTYLAAVYCSGLVRGEWPEALPITTVAAEAVGRPPTHGATEPPTVRHWDVLLHGLRHLSYLLANDATIAAALDGYWSKHLGVFAPAIARMYDRVHHSG